MLVPGLSGDVLNPVKIPLKELSTDGTESDQPIRQGGMINRTMIINTTQLS